MRKKSHIALGIYLGKEILYDFLREHYKSFVLGNLLPDCKISFIKERHEYGATVGMVLDWMQRSLDEWEYYEQHPGIYMRHLGEWMHYVADYFTWPHNTIYPGDIKDHCIYEGDLKFEIRDYLKSPEAPASYFPLIELNNIPEVANYLETIHEEYLAGHHNLKGDCMYIANVTHQLTYSLVKLFVQECERGTNKEYTVIAAKEAEIA